jgi:hypothetical protein
VSAVRGGGGRRPARSSSAATWGHAALAALLAGVCIWSPALVEPLAVTVALVAASAGLAAIEGARRRTDGSSPKPQRSAAARGLLAGTVSVFVVAIGASFTAAVLGSPEYCLPLAAVSVVLLVPAFWLSEHHDAG